VGRPYGVRSCRPIVALHSWPDGGFAAAAHVLAGYTGYFPDGARQPQPPGLPPVRAFQRAQADALLPWVRRRLPVQ
jgi:hypothetical protein